MKNANVSLASRWAALFDELTVSSFQIIRFRSILRETTIVKNDIPHDMLGSVFPLRAL